MDNFGCDPLARHSMLQAAENVAAKHQITTEQQHEVVLLREKHTATRWLTDARFKNAT